MRDGIIESFDKEHRWLSNFWPATVEFEGEKYPSVEHAYQAAKFPIHKRDQFSLVHASVAKKIGRTAILTEDWDAHRVPLMHSLLVQKFKPGSPLAARLIGTGQMELIEGNYWGDTFWGVCKRKGENHLGKLLMQIRASLIERGREGDG